MVISFAVQLLTWYNPICWLLVLFPGHLEFCSESPCLHLCLQEFSLQSRTSTLWPAPPLPPYLTRATCALQSISLFSKLPQLHTVLGIFAYHIQSLEWWSFSSSKLLDTSEEHAHTLISYKEDSGHILYLPQAPFPMPVHPIHSHGTTCLHGSFSSCKATLLWTMNNPGR